MDEPQLAFHKDANLLFNDNICIGCGDKTELLQLLRVKGTWRYQQDYLDYFKIPPKTPKQIQQYYSQKPQGFESL